MLLFFASLTPRRRACFVASLVGFIVNFLAGMALILGTLPQTTAFIVYLVSTILATWIVIHKPPTTTKAF